MPNAHFNCKVRQIALHFDGRLALFGEVAGWIAARVPGQPDARSAGIKPRGMVWARVPNQSTVQRSPLIQKIMLLLAHAFQLERPRALTLRRRPMTVDRSDFCLL
jgi:hypothetical protein